MPRQPEQGRQQEQQPRPYYLASRFKTKQEAEQPYFAVQETIKTMDCDLSAYRFLRQWQEPNDKPWYVFVVGQKPPEAVAAKITEILGQGEMASVPEQAVAQLYQRRLEEIQKGDWVEHHYKLQPQRRNPTKDKLKRKMQDKSRRRNRGN
jgi:hypothetical protein